MTTPCDGDTGGSSSSTSSNLSWCFIQPPPLDSACGLKYLKEPQLRNYDYCNASASSVAEDMIHGVPMHKWLAYAADRDLVAAQPRGSVYPEIYADMQSDGNFSGPLNQKHLYHGFLSGADVRRLVDPAWGGVWTTDKGRHVTMFTTLRHPVERAVSCASGPCCQLPLLPPMRLLLLFLPT